MRYLLRNIIHASSAIGGIYGGIYRGYNEYHNYDKELNEHSIFRHTIYAISTGIIYGSLWWMISIVPFLTPRTIYDIDNIDKHK